MATDLNQYIKDATRTESVIEQVEVDPALLAGVLQIYIAAGNMLDQIKKHVFYGKDYNDDKLKEEFINIVASLEQIKPAIAGEMEEGPMDVNPRVFHALVGIATEATELMEALTQPQLDAFNVLEEFGDLNWYQAIGIDALGGDFGNILRTNIEKLRARYPEKFDNDRAINRDTDAERRILEGNPLDQDGEGC